MSDLTTNFVAIDTETTGTSFHKPYDGFQYSCRPFIITTTDHNNESRHWQFNVDPHSRWVDYPRREIRDFISHISEYKYHVYHNAKFDLKALAKISADVRNITTEYLVNNRIHDTLPASHVISSQQSHGLKDLATQWLHYSPIDETILKERVAEARRAARKQNIPVGPSSGTDYWLPSYLDPYDTCALEYAINDTERTAKLWCLFVYGLIERGDLDSYLREHQLLHPLYLMETTGLRMDYERAEAMFIGTEHDNKLLLSQLQQITDNPTFNPRSSAQLCAYLYEDNDYPVLSYTATGNPSTNKVVINELAQNNPDDTFLTALLQYKKNETKINYLASYFDLGVEHKTGVYLFSNWNSNGTATTRTSSSAPNLQNINKHLSDNPDPDAVSIRTVFGPDDDHVWYCIDYDQLEARLFAHASQDETLCNCFATGGDFHQITADALNIPRSGQVASGKHVNFAWLYGAQPNKLAAMANIDDPIHFSEIMAETYPGAVEFQEETIRQARRTGNVRTLYGYPLDVSRNKAYIAVNYLIQGTAGDVAKQALLNLHNYLHPQLYPYVKILALIHDEYVFEIDRNMPYDETEIIEMLAYNMSNAGNKIGCELPVNVEICEKSWGSPKELFTLTTQPNSDTYHVITKD